MVSKRESKPTISISGRPFEAESVKLLSHIPSNLTEYFPLLADASIAIRADNPL